MTEFTIEDIFDVDHDTTIPISIDISIITYYLFDTWWSKLL